MGLLKGGCGHLIEVIITASVWAEIRVFKNWLLDTGPLYTGSTVITYTWHGQGTMIHSSNSLLKIYSYPELGINLGTTRKYLKSVILQSLDAQVKMSCTLKAKN